MSTELDEICTNPCVNGRVLVREEAQAEMTGLLPVQTEAIRALRRISGDKVLKEKI